MNFWTGKKRKKNQEIKNEEKKLFSSKGSHLFVTLNIKTKLTNFKFTRIIIRNLILFVYWTSESMCRMM